MNKVYIFMISLLFNCYLNSNCLPYSYLSGLSYGTYFPRLQSIDSSAIQQAISNFSTTGETSGKGAHGHVKLFQFTLADNRQVTLAIKWIRKNWTQTKLLSMVNDEIDQWKKVQVSSYVPSYYGCVEGRWNSATSKANEVYIIQQALNHDIYQGPYNRDGQQLPKLRDRVLFYSKLFRALDDVQNKTPTKPFVHGDIKPLNIMVGSQGYQGNPYIVDFGLADDVGAAIQASTPCYEYKGKQSIPNKNSRKLDVFSMGISIIELENDFNAVCKSYHAIMKDPHESFNLSQREINSFYSFVVQNIGLKALKPSVENVGQCQSLQCIIQFTVQYDFATIPYAADVAQALENLYTNMPIDNII